MTGLQAMFAVGRQAADSWIKKGRHAMYIHLIDRQNTTGI